MTTFPFWKERANWDDAKAQSPWLLFLHAVSGEPGFRVQYLPTLLPGSKGTAMRRERLTRFLRDEDATTAVEYAVMLALILVAVIAGVTSAGGGVGNWWGKIKTKVESY